MGWKQLKKNICSWLRTKGSVGGQTFINNGNLYELNDLENLLWWDWIIEVVEE
jgi:hypothetical protein